MRAPALRFALAGAVLFVALDRWLPAARSLPRQPAAPTLPAPRMRCCSTSPSTPASTAATRWCATASSTSGATSVSRPRPSRDAVVEREARTLGLVHSDPIIRRHLIDLMRLTAASLPPAALPDDAELRRYYAAHADAYALPDRVRLRTST